MRHKAGFTIIPQALAIAMVLGHPGLPSTVAAPSGHVAEAAWGDTGGEKGEVEAPRADVLRDGIDASRWGDTDGEKGEVEAPRADGIEAPRWGDTGGEKGEVEAPRSSVPRSVDAPRWGDTDGEKGEVEAPRS